MITHVSIRNFAILDEVELDLFPGFTVITGETGSGKSILLQAVGVATGDKATKTMIKSDSNRSSVEVEFQDRSFRRVLFSSGSSKSFVDEEPIRISDLQELSSGLLDFHGQHDQQLIMDPKNHIIYLDRFGGLGDKRDALESLYAELKNSRDELETRQTRLQNSREKIELLEFQKIEIEGVDPQPGEDETLDIEYRKLNNIDKIKSTVKGIQEYLVNQEGSASEQLTQAVKGLSSLTRFASDMGPVSNQVEDALISIQDAVDTALQIADDSEFDPGQLQEYSDRIHAIEGLKRKYGGSIEAVLDKLNSINSELADLSNLDDKLVQLKKKISDLESRYSSEAEIIHKKRLELIPPLAKAVESEMEALNMSGSKFEVRIGTKKDETSQLALDGIKTKFNPDGFDIVTFFLSANPGEIPKPLAEIASGGEVSRIMLAIKTVFNSIDPVQTLIFDEIDTGISGVTADKVARSLKALAENKQVICITHLPQIAKKADNHLHVVKASDKSSTNVTFHYVPEKDREAIIKQLHSGEDKLEKITA